MRYCILIFLLICRIGNAQTGSVKFDTLPSPGYAPYSKLELVLVGHDGGVCNKEIFFSIDRDSLYGFPGELIRPGMVLASGTHRICYQTLNQRNLHCEELTFYPSESYRLHLLIDCAPDITYSYASGTQSGQKPQVGNRPDQPSSKIEVKKGEDNNKEGSRWVGKTKTDTSLQGKSTVILYLQTPDGSSCKQSAKVIINGKDTVSYIPQSNGAMELEFSPGVHSLVCISKWFNPLYFQRIETGSNQSIELFGRFQAKANSMPQPVFNFDKPVIYLYPEKEELVTLELNFSGELGFTWPIYNDNWIVKASPNGELVTASDTVRYLFWEGKSPFLFPDAVLNTGFIVSRSEQISFLNQKLIELGLNSFERADFLTYWIPQLQNHDSVFVHFIFGTDYEKLVPLNVSPSPDSRIRIFMMWRPIAQDEEMILEPQQLQSVRRTGFSLIEWGGGRIPETKWN